MDNEIVIAEACDGFSIIVNGEAYWFCQEKDKTKLVEVFKHLGFDDVTYEEDY